MAASAKYSWLGALALLGYLLPLISTQSLGNKDKPNPFHVDLRHIDAGRNFTKFERLYRGIQRSKIRMQEISAGLKASRAPPPLETPVHLGSGEFLMDLAIGGPSGNFTAIMDTGSDLTWTQCEPCIECFDQPTPVFDPRKSNSYENVSCTDKLCQALNDSATSCGENGTCHYLYGYGDYSSSEGTLAKENFWFSGTLVPKLAFGCGNDNSGTGFIRTAGLVGLGRGPLSLISQLGEGEFSYCLTSVHENPNITSELFMGSLDYSNVRTDLKQNKSTPMIMNPKQPTFYYITLEGITVGDKRIDVNKSQYTIDTDGSGGLILDSGTTLTYLHGDIFDLVATEFKNQINLTAADEEIVEFLGLELCFEEPKGNGTETVVIPNLVFHIEGVDLELPTENYLANVEGMLCVLMGTSPVSMSILGNSQQQNFLITYNLEMETMSFLPTECGKLHKG